MAFRAQPAAHDSRKHKAAPAAETFQEANYLKSLCEKRKTVSIKLYGGEEVEGWIEYYDRDMLRLTREHAPNLFIFKHDILYLAEHDGKRK